MAAGRMRSTRRLRSWIVEQVCVAVCVCVCMSVRGRQGEGEDKWKSGVGGEGKQEEEKGDWEVTNKHIFITMGLKMTPAEV